MCIHHVAPLRNTLSALFFMPCENDANRMLQNSLTAGGANISEPAVDTCCLISAVAIRKAPASPNDCRSPVWNTGRFAAMNIAACAGINTAL